MIGAKWPLFPAGGQKTRACRMLTTDLTLSTPPPPSKKKSKFTIFFISFPNPNRSCCCRVSEPPAGRRWTLTFGRQRRARPSTHRPPSKSHWQEQSLAPSEPGGQSAASAEKLRKTFGHVGSNGGRTSTNQRNRKRENLQWS